MQRLARRFGAKDQHHASSFQTEMDVLSYSGRPGDFHVFFIVFLGVRSASELMDWVVKRNKDTPLVSIVAISSIQFD